jgi:hypothetical protein
VVRQEHEEALERFASLEDATAGFSAPKRVSRLHLPASTAQVRLSATAAGDGRSVRQLMPTFAAGIAAIEIRLPGPPTGRGGSVQVDLLAGGDADPVHRWTVPAEQLREGWLRLFLDKAATSREQDATLAIAWEADGPGSVALNLSRPLPLKEFCGVLDDGSLLSAPLALRVWGMVPGATVSEAVLPALTARGATPGRPGPSERVRFPLAAEDLGTVGLLKPPELDPGFTVVEFRQDEADVLVHPFWGAPTVAIVRDVNVRGLEKISALAYVERGESKPVEFGLAAVTQRALYEAPGELIRTWTPAEPQVLTEVAGTVDVTRGKPVDLLLATRMLDNTDPSFAWAYFKRIEVIARSDALP